MTTSTRRPPGPRRDPRIAAIADVVAAGEGALRWLLVPRVLELSALPNHDLERSVRAARLVAQAYLIAVLKADLRRLEAETDAPFLRPTPRF